ncbi:hypothetical protein [Stenotrophomonas rhizophila]|uniref:hypothetical protein n=1 Tax=Stenotrophomonas rhizophila TaxID=216778 RepID=UPI0028AC04B9|nr:hypothetical protein [Stenotrophomonas rhizophila]
MNSFNDRIEAQRSILRAVNSALWPVEPLHGLSRKSIDRWMIANRVDPHCPIVDLILSAAGKLMFLANKSQEQITDEYSQRVGDINSIVIDIAREALQMKQD